MFDLGSEVCDRKIEHFYVLFQTKPDLRFFLDSELQLKINAKLELIKSIELFLMR